MTSEELRKAQGLRLKEARIAAGFRSAREAAVDNRWPESSYAAHERGGRTIGLDDAERYARRFRLAGVQTSARQIMFGDEDDAGSASSPTTKATVPIMGFIGAGAEISPDFEQVPPEGLDQVELPFSIPDELIGFEVRGDSMLPKYEDGDVVVVFREQQRSTESMIGDNVAVRTFDGRRFLKRLLRGTRPQTYNLESFNARLIEDVRIEWASSVFATVHRAQVRRARASASRAGKHASR